jgi:diguanylate cyclase
MFDSEFNTRDIAEITKRALVKMGQLGIPCTPENYHVWFEYFLGSNEDLTAGIDEMLASGKSFEEKTNIAIYEKHLGKGKDRKLMQEIQAETQKMLKGIFEQILSANKSASGYTNKLEEYSRKLTAAEQLSHIQEVIANIINDTQEMEESSSHLQKKLEEATTQTENLRRRLQTTEKEAMKDALTGLANRKSFDQKAKALYEEYKKEGNGFSVIMLDIDHFKQFNDKYGHSIGDEVLRKVGTSLHEGVKGGDLPARYGGEEFVVLLPRTTLDNACIVAEHIRKNISEKKLKRVSTGESLGNITVSLGVSEIRTDDTIETVLERADKALYLAKGSGRNNFKCEKDL